MDPRCGSTTVALRYQKRCVFWSIPNSHGTLSEYNVSEIVRYPKIDSWGSIASTQALTRYAMRSLEFWAPKIVFFCSYLRNLWQRHQALISQAGGCGASAQHHTYECLWKVHRLCFRTRSIEWCTLFFWYTGAFKRCFNRKIEPVFSVGTGDPERSSYGPNMARRVLKSRLFYRHCIAQSFPFQFWARHQSVGTSWSSTEQTPLYNRYMGSEAVSLSTASGQ